jgi:hypothetical protein
MDTLAIPTEVTRIAACLATGWEFLSGERHVFEVVTDAAPEVTHAEFSYFMPLAAHDSQETGGVGVFIQRGDARVVAANMFGEPSHDIQPSNLSDACAEACNVLAECLTLNITKQANITIGLPFRADDLAYAEIRRNCAPVAIYQCNTHTGQLFVIAYEIYNSK